MWQGYLEYIPIVICGAATGAVLGYNEGAGG
jgi:hypothetical protein